MYSRVVESAETLLQFVHAYDFALVLGLAICLLILLCFICLLILLCFIL